MARTNSVALSVVFTQSNMAEACSLPLGAMHTASATWSQQIYVTTKQFVTRCSKISSKCLVS